MHARTTQLLPWYLPQAQCHFHINSRAWLVHRYLPVQLRILCVEQLTQCFELRPGPQVKFLPSGIWQGGIFVSQMQKSIVMLIQNFVVHLARGNSALLYKKAQLDRHCGQVIGDLEIASAAAKACTTALGAGERMQPNNKPGLQRSSYG